jgi:hypothetical protein
MGMLSHTLTRKSDGDKIFSIFIPVGSPKRNSPSENGDQVPVDILNCDYFLVEPFPNSSSPLNLHVLPVLRLVFQTIIVNEK